MSNKQIQFIAVTLFLPVAFCALPSTLLLDCKNFNDCQSLLKFKEGLSDPNGHLQAWNNTSFFCNWTGVTCHPNLQNRVIALELINMGLWGRISPYISNLSLLTNISLQDNSFYGDIPTSLGKLSELTFVNMSGNKLGGSIPGALQGCHSLKIVDLTYNNLSGNIPYELGQLKNLTYLALSVNNLSGNIPYELGQLKNLTYLALSVNSLTGAIREWISNLTELTNLQLAVNYFTGKIPPGIGSLTKLETMYFHTNYFEGTIPASIGNCTALRQISLSENLLNGEIPAEIGAKLYNLERVHLLQNQFTGRIPVSLSNLSQLTLLDLSLNKLEGQVPPELGKLQKLEILYLHSNDLVSGSNNSSLSFLTALTNCSFLLKLHLGSCLFGGSLPASIGDLSKDLYYLNLRENRITGEIPDGIGNLSSLVSLYLHHNFLNGKIPATIGKLEQLQRLLLAHNKLIGPISDDMGQMVNLGLLDLDGNMISGSIPSALGKLTNLRYLILSRNHLSGNIPQELTQCSNLMLLDLSYNNLKGSLPTEISRFLNLALSLNLSNNNLEGELPASVGNLASSPAIDLSKNKFSGPIPSSIGKCVSLEYFNLSNNMLEGTIPDSLKQITHLAVLDLAFNKLTGNVPFWIRDNQMIKHLNLSYNRLTGEVPNTWRFENLGRRSFIGNAGLCSGSVTLGLPPCKVEKQKRKKKKWVHYVLAISISCALLLFVLVIVFVRFRYFKNSEESEAPILMASPRHYESRTFTQRELEIATDEFDEANLLGKGSFGSVYKAIVNEGKTVMAVKVLHKECSQSCKSFKRECQILSGIKHRNLVRMMGATWNSQFKAVVLEFIGNGNLEQHLYPGGSEGGGNCVLTLRERLGIAIDLSHALEYLHEGCSVQVVHCDLKPPNVLLDDDMVAHVADFGIGKLISTDKRATNTTSFLRGSIGYIPPEYGQGIEVSATGDVYSFGVMMLEMITRKRPTSEMFSNGLDLRTWVLSAFPNHILDIVDISLVQKAGAEDMSGALSRIEQCCNHMLDVGMMCTEKNPRERPPISLVAQRLKAAWKEMRFEAQH